MRSYNEKNIKAYDKKAKNYDNSLDGKFTEKFKELLVANMVINDNYSILDVGCGNGNLLSKISRQNKINGFGTDISPKMIENAKARYPEFDFVVSNCEKIPFDDYSMDVITVCAAYHHFPNVSAFASEAKRLLKPSGSLYIAEVHLPAVLRLIANFFLPLSRDGDVKFYSFNEIANTFCNVEFSLVNMIKKRHMQVIQFQGKQA